MAGLLGKAAASNWKRATFGARESKDQVDWRALSLDIRAQRAAETHLSQTALSAAHNIVAAAAADGKTHAPPTDPAARRTSVASSAARVYNPDKQKEQQVGHGDPDAASRALRAQLSQRASIDAVLSQMERVIARQGPARRLGKSDSRQITRAVNKSMMAGASKQVRHTAMQRMQAPCFRVYNCCCYFFVMRRCQDIRDAFAEAVQHCDVIGSSTIRAM